MYEYELYTVRNQKRDSRLLNEEAMFHSSIRGCIFICVRKISVQNFHILYM
jgi:hypothetical protein